MGREGVRMALVLSFRCGRCGKEYAVYYPKAVVYPLYGQGTREQGAREDEEEAARGALRALQERAEQQGKTWVNAGEQQQVVCTCGKSLNLDLAQHPRVPQTRPGAARQVGLIPFGPTPRKPS
jgi:type II secretory pathway pseudopilin PulG